MNKEIFLEECKKLGVFPTKEQMDQLNTYYHLLITWNEKMNLTGITEKNEVYLKHFYDSLTIVKAIDLKKIETLCDVGTGAGFPGMVLKILFPQLKVTLVDSLNKRISFLNEVIKTLNLKGICAIHARVEEYAKQHREEFDLVSARAVASLNTLLEYTTPLLKVGSSFVSMKGNISREIIEAEHACKVLNTQVTKVISFELPIEKSSRTLIVVTKEKKTNPKYPRKFSEIKKHPL